MACLTFYSNRDFAKTRGWVILENVSKVFFSSCLANGVGWEPPQSEIKI